MLKRIIKKLPFYLVTGIILFYGLVHLLLASSPVQQRVLKELRSVLATVGIDLEMESFEFATFSAKLYLNRVTLKTNAKAEVKFPEPLNIDKIRIEFSPLALFYRQIVIDEIALFHPRILLPEADVLYHKISKVLTEKSGITLKRSGDLNVRIKRIGVVDALVHVLSQEPEFQIHSRSISAFLEQSSRDQQTIKVESSNLEVVRGPLRLELSKVDVDIDLSKSSVRANKFVLEGQDLSVNLKGAASFPLFKQNNLDSTHLIYAIKLPLHMLSKIPPIKLPQFGGLLNANGNLDIQKGIYSGKGDIQYEGLTINGKALGNGLLDHRLDEKKVVVNKLNSNFGEGKITSNNITVELNEKNAVLGQLNVQGVKLDSVLKAMNIKNPPLRMLTSGQINVSGQLQGPLNLIADVSTEMKDFKLYNRMDQALTRDNTILDIAESKLKAQVHISPEKVDLTSTLSALGGELNSTGAITYDGKIKIASTGKNLSLTKLSHIAGVDFGGNIESLNSNVTIAGSDVTVEGNFDLKNGEVQGFFVGDVTGNANYDDFLLSFENLFLKGIEPIRGEGFVDFRPVDNHFKFNVSIPRISVEQAFKTFQKTELPFPIPTGGEVSNGIILIEGGVDPDGVEVKISGNARNFNWYNEKWFSSFFSLTYHPSFVDFKRGVFVKKSGALEVSGRFEKQKSRLRFLSHGLHMEEFTYFGTAPVVGEVSGEVTLEGDLSKPKGKGDLRLTRTAFRGVSIPDSSLKVSTQDGRTEFLGSFSGDKLRARWLKTAQTDGSEQSELLLYLTKMDVAPFLTVWMGKDIPPIESILATGDFSLNGDFQKVNTLNGSGTFNEVVLGLRTSPLRNEKPIEISVNKGDIQVKPFKLLGEDSQIMGNFNLEQGNKVSANFDAKMDLQFIQPFIPGLAYGIGKVSGNFRLSGRPEKYSLLGNVIIEDSVFRLMGLESEFRSANAQLTISQDKINVDRFEALLGGGKVLVNGEVGLDRFTSFKPDIQLSVSQVSVKARPSLTLQLDGNLFVKGDKAPYLMGGSTKILEAKLTELNDGDLNEPMADIPALKFDVTAEAPEKLYAVTDVLNAEFKGSLRLLGDTNKVALLGTLESVNGSMFFKEVKFDLLNGTVKFEDPKRIYPRFNLSGRSFVKEQVTTAPREFEVNLLIFGVPEDYKIRLTSTPDLAEADLISLLVLGVTSRDQGGTVVDLGTSIVGQTPLQSKLKNELGLGIKVEGKSTSSTNDNTTGDATGMVPSVKVQKDIGNKTKVSASNPIGGTGSLPEFRIEHLLNENFNINATSGEKSKATQSTGSSNRSFGVDLRYNFSFE